MTRWGRAVLVSCVVALAGCTPSGATDTTDTTAPTTTTRVPRVTDNSTRPQITFDPCLDIPLHTMADLGYEPATIHELAYPMGDYSFLGCMYRSTGPVEIPRKYLLVILSANVTLDEEYEKDGEFATHTQINGRPGLLEINTALGGSCSYVLSTDFGTVHYLRTTYSYSGDPIPLDEWCTGFDDFIATVEPLIEP